MNPEIPAMIALFAGFGVAVLLFVPFVARRYRKDGRLTLWQLIVWVAFIVYAMSLWTYTMLPLPAVDDIRCTTPQLVPFRFVDDIVATGGVHSLRDLITNRASLARLFNVLLFLPLGVFLRVTFRRGVVVATLLGLAISLVIEFTQGTGVWGVFPCAYRIFDVDDLIANTAGATLGSLLALPWRWASRAGGDDARTGVVARSVTRGRRFVGMLCDLLVMMLSAGLVGTAVSAWQLYIADVPRAAVGEGAVQDVLAWLPLAVVTIVVLATGRTPGDFATAIRFRDERGRVPVPLARLLRLVGGIGGWELLSLLGDYDVPGLGGGWAALFAAVAIAFWLFAPRRGGLPGVVSGQRPVDARAPDAART